MNKYPKPPTTMTIKKAISKKQKVMKPKTVKVKETTTVPETGEQTNLYLWAMLAIASSASILVLRRYKKYGNLK